MRVLVYEHLSAHGDSKLPASLRAEGAAMLNAVASDFAACVGCEVVTSTEDHFEAAIIIAPETNGVLTHLVGQIERHAGVTLLSPSSSFCAWASDKTQVAERILAASVPMPRGIVLCGGDGIADDFPRPAVWKPNDGCGSQGIVFLPPAKGEQRPDETVYDVAPFACGPLSSPNCCRDGPLPVEEAARYRVEEFVPGMAVSIALLRGPTGVFPLPPCEQRLSADGKFAYLGGRCPLEPALAARAERLAHRAARAMPDWRGYIGLDLVLGQAVDGSDDYLIEINPRLTTSYVGLRALSETNLAQAMLDVVAGGTPQLAFFSRGVEFDAHGTVRYV